MLLEHLIMEQPAVAKRLTGIGRLRQVRLMVSGHVGHQRVFELVGPFLK